MLVLTRALHEQLLIDHTICVTILAIGRHGEVKLGIQAPPEISIVRAELLGRPVPASHREEPPAPLHPDQIFPSGSGAPRS